MNSNSQNRIRLVCLHVRSYGVYHKIQSYFVRHQNLKVMILFMTVNMHQREGNDQVDMGSSNFWGVNDENNLVFMKHIGVSQFHSLRFSKF